MTCGTQLKAYTRFFVHFFYVKSADWPGNKPHPLKARTAIELAQMPTYYVMDLGKTMPQTVAPFQPSAAEVLAWQMAHRAGTCGVHGRIRPHRVPRRPADVSRLFGSWPKR